MWMHSWFEQAMCFICSDAFSVNLVGLARWLQWWSLMRDIPLQQGGGTGRSSPTSTPHSRRELGKFSLFFFKRRVVIQDQTQRTRYFVGIVFVITSCNRIHCKLLFSIWKFFIFLVGRLRRPTSLFFFLSSIYWEWRKYLFYHIKRTNLWSQKFFWVITIIFKFHIVWLWLYTICRIPLLNLIWFRPLIICFNSYSFFVWNFCNFF